MLTDTGPLVAILNKTDPDYKRCRDFAAELSKPLITTWPVLAEAMHLLYNYDGWRGQRHLLDMILDGDLIPRPLELMHVDRIRILMDKYHDAPMDFADASLVALAESLNINRIFTLDNDFRIYRLHNAHPFEVVP